MGFLLIPVSNSFRSLTPKSRIIALNDAFLSYLRADGIILPPESPVANRPDLDSDSGIATDSDSDQGEDPALSWPDIHAEVRAVIKELGGKVLPKLNWSAPKDATWISPTNDMECRTPNEVYLLLKSSDFITHDLQHAFDGCVSAHDDRLPIPYVLVLRKSFNLNPSLEFRCFVRDHRLIAISQREMNYFPFLAELQSQLRETIYQFFTSRLMKPDYLKGNDMSDFVFDVYIPPPHDRVWLIDINPWAARTDPLLFSWLEILTMPHTRQSADMKQLQASQEQPLPEGPEGSAVDQIEFRLVGRDDPEAYQFGATKYSAHKLPLDVVHAGNGSAGVAGMTDLMSQWQKALTKQGDEDEDDADDVPTTTS